MAIDYRKLLLDKLLSGPLDRPTRWRVITGAPSAGKTTLIEALKKKGHPVLMDVNRAYIEEELAKGRRKEEIRFGEEYQAEVAARMVLAETDLDPEKPIFLDYALPCNLAFHRLDGIPVPDFIERTTRLFRYKHIFLLKPLPWMDDEVRAENEDMQLTVSAHLFEVYRERNYKVHVIPPVSVKARLAMVEAACE